MIRLHCLYYDAKDLGTSGADLGIIRGGVCSGPKFFKGGLGSRSAGIFIY